MNNNDSFLKTLKRINCHEAAYLDDSNIHSLLSTKELRSFFEVFCTLNERNVLTTEEIEEYSSLTAAELSEIEIWKKKENFYKANDEDGKKKEVLFLQEHLALIEKHNKSIERQVDLFKKHEEQLLEEKEFHEIFLLNAKKKFQSFEMNKIPQAEKEFVSKLKSILKVAQDLELLIVHSDVSENKLPTSNIFKDVVQQYIDAEEKVFQSVKVYFMDNFQLEENDTLSFIIEENRYRQELKKEALFLQKISKSGMMSDALHQKELQKHESILKYLQNAQISELNCHPSQLKFTLEDSLKLNEQLKKKEEELKVHASDAISKYVDALLTRIDLSATDETYHIFQQCIKEMSLPIKTLAHQRARLEILIASLSGHKGELESLKEQIQKVLCEMKKEKSCLEERKILIENEMDDVAEKKESLPEAQLISSLYKILSISEDLKEFDLSKVSMTDVVQKTNKLLEAKESCIRKSEEKMKAVELLEKHAHCMELLLNSNGMEYLDWLELEQDLNVNLNNLELKLTALAGNLSECNQDLDQKQKILNKKGNLRLARSLYAYALLNKELFKKCIDDIKIAQENSAGYKS